MLWEEKQGMRFNQPPTKNVSKGVKNVQKYLKAT